MYEKYNADALASQFAPYILAFVSEKRGVGNKYNTEAAMLRRFDEFVVERGLTDSVVTKEIFESWAVKRRYESDKTHFSRFNIVQQLCKYMVRINLESYVSPLMLKYNKSAFKPYILEQLESFLPAGFYIFVA